MDNEQEGQVYLVATEILWPLLILWTWGRAKEIRKDARERHIMVGVLAPPSFIILEYSLNDRCVPGEVLADQDTVLGAPSPHTVL